MYLWHGRNKNLLKSHVQMYENTNTNPKELIIPDVSILIVN